MIPTKKSRSSAMHRWTKYEISQCTKIHLEPFISNKKKETAISVNPRVATPMATTHRQQGSERR
eukprot:Awhi_evm1s4346